MVVQACDGAQGRYSEPEPRGEAAFVRATVLLSNGRVSIRRGRRKEKLNGVNLSDDLVHLLQVLSRYITNGEVVGERGRGVVRVGIGCLVDGVIVSGLEQFLEPVGSKSEPGPKIEVEFLHGRRRRRRRGARSRRTPLDGTDWKENILRKVDRAIG